MSFTYVCLHFGLGDHIICKGLINRISKKYDVVFVLGLIHQNIPLTALYKDLHNVKLILFENWQKAFEYIDKIPPENQTIIGHKHKRKKITFDVGFYRQFGLDIKHKYSDFTIMRDREDENKLYKKLVKRRNYVVAHLDTFRGLSPQEIEIVKKEFRRFQVIFIDPELDGKSGLFSWLKILENAHKLILTNSSTLNIVNQLNINNKPNARIYYKSKSRRRSEDLHLNGHWEYR